MTAMTERTSEAAANAIKQLEAEIRRSHAEVGEKEKEIESLKEQCIYCWDLQKQLEAKLKTANEAIEKAFEEGYKYYRAEIGMSSHVYDMAAKITMEKGLAKYLQVLNADKGE